jgi:hypothetical protein
MRRYILLAVLIACTFASPPAFAIRDGDMFDEQGITVQNRPWVPSDEYYGYTGLQRDMFPSTQLFMRSGKDMFDFMQPSGDPNIEGRFSAHIRGAPPTPLFHNPNLPAQYQ